MLENGQRVVYLNGYKEGMSAEERLGLGITLQHEAYRDGVKGSNQELETVQSVFGHTAMAQRMLDDGQTLDTGGILEDDLAAYQEMLAGGGIEAFVSHVLGNYDSSADYWKLVVNEDGSHKFQWDGHLNIYDEEGNELVHYTDLLDLIQGSNKNVQIGGAIIALNELKVLQRYNKAVVDYGIKNPSIASTFLLSDGFMSNKEAEIIGGIVLQRKYGKTDDEGPNMIEHYSARYILNETSALAMAAGADIASWMNPVDRSLADLSFGIYKPSRELNFQSAIYGFTTLSMELLATNFSIFHGAGNFKWQSDTGNELVFRNGKIETDPRYIGTFNWGKSVKDHYTLDVKPYDKWGNSPDDLSNLNNRFNKYFGRLY